MRQLYPLVILVAVAVAVGGSAACKSKKTDKGAHPNPGAAIFLCRKALDGVPKKPTVAQMRAIVATCAKMLSESKCVKELSALKVNVHIDNTLPVLHRCLCAYCPRLKSKKLGYCTDYCSDPNWLDTPRPAGQISERGFAMWDAVRHLEYGATCSQHRASFELISRLIGLINPIDMKPSWIPRPCLAPPNLTVLITEKGYYIKSRHGAECPAGVPADKRVCIPKSDGKFSAAVLKKLQHHMWYLFASKYKIIRGCGLEKDSHTLTLMREPTVKYDDIVRTIDVLREIPRDAKKPLVKHTIPPGGCQMMYDAKLKRLSFARHQGKSVRDTACMYNRITLILGSG